METIRKELIKHESDKIESIKARIAELDEYKIELEDSYNELQSEVRKTRTLNGKENRISSIIN